MAAPLENLLDGNGVCRAQPRKLEAYNPRAAGAWVCIRSLGRAGRQEARRRSRQRQAWWRAITFDTRMHGDKDDRSHEPQPQAGKNPWGPHPRRPFIKLAAHCTVQYAPLFFPPSSVYGVVRCFLFISPRARKHFCRKAKLLEKKRKIQEQAPSRRRRRPCSSTAAQ